MAWWEVLVGILLFIVALSVLIGIHELGHLSAAKLFNVYCFDYSIGFGPKIIGTKRTPNHETTWTLRAIPLGGFVSMYGEGSINDTGTFIPPSRSLEGVARYKRAIIVSAGVFLNFILGFFLILFHNCFDQIYFDFNHTGTRVVADTNINETLTSHEVNNQTVVCSFDNAMKEKGYQDGDRMESFLDPIGQYFILDQDVKIGNGNTTYVLCMSNVLSTTKIDAPVSSLLEIYERQNIDTLTKEASKGNVTLNVLVSWISSNSPNKTKQQIIDELNDVTKNMSNEQKELYYKDRFKSEADTYYERHDIHYTLNPNVKYNINENTPNIDINIWMYKNNNPVNETFTISHNNSGGIKDIGIYLKRFAFRYDASSTLKVTWNEWCEANVTVFKGIGMLFTGKGEVGGFIQIAKTSTVVLSGFGFERFLYLWGMISCNLAILNLLPFPGLDGWQLVVIIYEAIVRKPIPTKVKGIISYIGLALLLVLMVVVTVKDIIGLF